MMAEASLDSKTAPRLRVRSALVISCLVVTWLCLASSGPVQFSDNGILMVAAAEGRLLEPRVFATLHPTFQLLAGLLARMFGAGALAYLNPLLGLGTLGVTFALGRQLRMSARASFAGALTFTLAHAAFWVGTKAEVYSLHVVLFLAALTLLLRASDQQGRHGQLTALAAGVLAGLSIGSHQLSLVLAPALCWLLLAQRARLALVLLGALIGLIPLFYSAYFELAAGSTALQVVTAFLTGHTASHPGWSKSLFELGQLASELRYVAIALFSLVGMQLVGLVHPRLGSPARWSLYACALLNLAFAVSYGVPDRFTFVLPGVAILSLFGAERTEGWLSGWLNARTLSPALLAACFVAPSFFVLVYAAMALLGLRAPQHSRALAGRDDIKYFMVPYLGDDSAARFVSGYLAHVPEGSTVFADFSPFGAFEAARVTGRLGNYHVADEHHPCSEVAPGGYAYTPRAELSTEVRARLEAVEGGFRLRCP
jgi:Protein of unknown function (DUF2723)